MTLPAMWIRKNMLQSPSPSFSTNDRTLTEAEMKVQRSLQKLSIPEWYLNNSSRPPKILSNDAPIESRPPVWKEQPLNKTIVCSTPVMPARNLTVNRNGVLETEIGPSAVPSFGTYRINRNSPTERSPVAKKRSAAAANKSHVPEKKSSRCRLMNVSRTFPRVSPSRKIQNINIVFPPSSDDSPSPTATSVNLEESSMTDMTADSLEATTPIVEADVETSRLADTSVTSNSSTTTISRLPNQKLTYIKPWNSPVPFGSPEARFSTVRSFKNRASSTPQGSPVSLFSESTVEAAGRKDENPAPSATSTIPTKPEASKITRQPPKVAPRTAKPIFADDDEMCDACKADVSRRSTPSPPVRSSSGFRPRNLCPIDEKRPITPRLRPSAPGASSVATNSPTVAFFTSRKKSSQLENIVKQKNPRKDGKSLVQEIIEELNEKCRNSAQPTYVTPGSKNFVRKLVRALEKGTTPSNVTEEPIARCERVVDCPEDSEDPEDELEEEAESAGSEDDAKSAAASTSISYKDTDSGSNSSDSELRSPTIKPDYSYDWNMNVEKNVSDTTSPDDSETRVAEKDDESVYWIPVTKSKLPRTSSLLSMISRLSTTSPGQQSPCVSPIRQSGETKRTQPSSNVWGLTYRTGDHVRTLRRIDETTVLDSGYSDRSRGHSSGSSDDTWFDDAEATRTASEAGSFSSFSLGSYGSRRSRAQVVGRPFVI